MDDIWLTLEVPLQIVEQRAYYSDFFVSWRDFITEAGIVSPAIAVRVWNPIWMWGATGGICLVFPTSCDKVNGTPCLLSCFISMSPAERDRRVNAGNSPLSVGQFVWVNKAIGTLSGTNQEIVSILFDVSEHPKSDYTEAS